MDEKDCLETTLSFFREKLSKNDFPDASIELIKKHIHTVVNSFTSKKGNTVGNLYTIQRNIELIFDLKIITEDEMKELTKKIFFTYLGVSNKKEKN